MKQFINEIYLCEQPSNVDIFCKLTVSTKDIYDMVTKYSSIFERRTPQSFAAWCRNNRMKFMNKKDHSVNGKRVRELYVLDEVYHDNLIESIIKYLPEYQRSIKKLIQEGYEIAGSARKSPGDEDEDTRIRLLQEMINNLTERSFAQRIYLSANSRSSTPFFERDLKPHDSVISKLNEF